MKKYVIIAGVNGAGKSTLYQINDGLKNMPRINVDEIVRDFGDWRNLRDVFSAGRIAVEKISQYLSDGISFNQETTLCGKSIIKNILKAKELGYFIELHYVSVDSVQIAKDRVRHRVDNLIAFYDNTESFRRFAICKNGELVRISKNVPVWFSKVEIEHK